ncbi:MAG: hypothetical protein ACYTG6_05335 [Planctomycetota bacterium]|jgi:hypothetical protein
MSCAPHRSTRPTALALLLCLLVTGCGRTDAPAESAFQDGRPTARRVGPGCQGKPGSAIGDVKAAVVDRPAADRAVIEAAWTRGVVGHDPELRLLLPQGAWLVRGDVPARSDASAAWGRARWEVAFETGRALDAVLRLEADTEDGRCSRETYVRLSAAP